MSLKPEQRRQAEALAAYLRTLPEIVRNAALFEIGATPAPPEARPGGKPRVCSICGRVYPVCRRIWSADHDFQVKA